MHLAVGGFFLFGALRMASRDAQTRPDGGIDRFGIAVGGLLAPANEEAGPPGPFGVWDLMRTLRAGFPEGLRETLVALGLAAIIFPPFAIGFSWWHGPAHDFAFSTPDDFASFCAAQVVVVGLPEEAFFRGFMQTRLGDHFGKARRWFGVELHPWTLLSQAALFAFIHFAVDMNPARLAVFFPGLVFGWVRAWRGGIGAAIALHALMNIYSELLLQGWMR